MNKKTQEISKKNYQKVNRIEFRESMRCQKGMTVKHKKFCCGWGTDCGSKLIVVIFWMIMVVEVPLYLVNVFYFMKWLVGFSECWAFTATWIHLIGLGLGCSWVPFAVLLADWEKNVRLNRKCIYFIYLFGVVVSLALGPLSLWMISMYWNDEEMIYKEWYTSTENALKSGRFPRWLTDLGWPKFLGLVAVDCCAWHGPLNLGVTYNFSVLGAGKKLTMDTMDQISACYNDLFSTTQKGSLLSFELKTEMESLPPGCGPLIREDLKELSFFICSSCIVQTVLALSMVLGYSYYPICFIRNMQRSFIATAIHHKDMRKLTKVYPSDSDSVNDLKGPLNSPQDEKNLSRSISPPTMVINNWDDLDKHMFIRDFNMD